MLKSEYKTAKNGIGGRRMEDFLLKKISAISEEEQQILEGRGFDKARYTGEGDFIVSSDKMTGKERDITVRTHTRYVDFPVHKHNYLEMMIVLCGSITHTIGEELLTLEEGDILILNKHISHSIKKADTPDIGVNVIISDSFMDTLSASLADTVFADMALENSKADGAGMFLYFKAQGNKQINNIIENMLFELTEYRSDMKILRGTVSLLFNYLSLKSESMLRQASHRPGRESGRMKQILSYVKSNYRSATLGELSDIMYLSSPYLSKLISEYFGMSFKEMLLAERIERARELILKTDLPIGDIIHSVGYENESYFHRAYRAATGKTPLATRKEAGRG